jgi:hypothetical protein
MSLFDKIKLLFVARKPAADFVANVKDIKRGFKTIHFWVTLLGSAGALFAAVKGFVPPEIGLIVTTVLVASYNIMRGFDKTDESIPHPALQSTELWLGILGQLSNAILALQKGGVASTHLVAAGAVIAGAMSIAQNLTSINSGLPAPIPAQPAAPKA